MGERLARLLADESFRHSWDMSDERKVDGAWVQGLCCECGEFVPYGEEVDHFAAAFATVLDSWLETVAGDAAVREAVAEAVGDAWLDDGHGLACQYRNNPHDVTAATSADAAVAALLAAVRAS